MKHQTKIRPDTKQLINLSQINQAIFPLRIDAQGLADYGFLPATTYMGAKYYLPQELPNMRRTLALGALWPEGEVTHAQEQLPEQIPDSNTLWQFLTKGMTPKEIQSLSAHDQKVYRERAAKNWATIRREASAAHPASSPTQCNTN